jgi:ribulose-bisphosphate carboxylase small chain
MREHNSHSGGLIAYRPASMSLARNNNFHCTNALSKLASPCCWDAVVYPRHRSALKNHERGGGKVQPGEDSTVPQSPADRVLGQIEYCLRQGCVICIEHTPMMTPRYSPWEIWGTPCCYNGNVQPIYSEIDCCRSVHADHHIRLNIEDHSCRSRFSFVVHSPSAASSL